MSPALIVVQSIAFIVYLFATNKLMQVFFDKRQTSRTVMLGIYFLLFCATLLYYISLHLGNPGGYIAYQMIYISAFFVATLNYKSSLLKRLAVSAFSFVLYDAILMVLVYFVFTPLRVNGLLFVFGLFYWYSLFDIVTFTVLYFAGAMMSRHLSLIKQTTYDTYIFWWLTLIMSCAAILTNFWLTGNFPVANMTAWRAIITMITVVFALFVHNIHSRAIKQELKSFLNANEKEYYLAQCQLMQESVENTKSIRHDMQLHLATARDFIANNKSDEAENYLGSLIGNIDRNEIYSNTKNIAFDSIINFKLSNARQENIKLDLRLLIPPALNIEVADIVIIIGNLLDNALDAVSKAEEKLIKLDIEYSKESLFIQIENTFDGVIQYTEKTDEDEKRIVTRKDSGEHGHGLKNIRKSVEKYNGHFDITHEGNTFSAVVLLYVDVV